MKRFILPLAGLLLCGAGFAQNNNVPFANTIQVTSTDNQAEIINKAAHIVPTPNQLRALQNEFIAFVHIGPNTFTRMEWGNGMEDPKIFDLKELDTDQWCEAMKAAGMKMVILTVKHHDGFVLWQSRYTNHGIMSTNFRGGKGDILKDLSASCKKYGLKLGIYLSPADLYQIENPQGLYGNGSKYSMRTIPREVPGRPFKNKTKFKFYVDDYNEYFLNQLFELLTEYGPVEELWFDGAHPKQKGGQQYQYKAWEELIRTLAPKAVSFGRKDIRWCGNEAGQTRSTEWNVLPYQENPDTMSRFPDMTPDDLGSREKLYTAKYLHYQQAETNTSIREGWFYRDDERQRVRSTDDVFDIYERSVGGNSTFLLNIPPNREGRFSPADVKVLHETGERIRETYGKNLLKGAKGPKALLDNKYDTFAEITEPVIITLSKPATINRLVLQEPVAQRSERVEEHAIDVWMNGEWKEIVRATNIGYKRILRLPEVTTNKLRIRILSSRLTPALCQISAHYYAARPPQLSIQRSADGMVSIVPRKQDFGWKSHGVNATENLSAGYEIFYTTDGSTPTAQSTRYTGPFNMERGELKAIAVLNNQVGALMHEQVCLPKAGWQMLTSSTDGKHAVADALDGNPQTYWMSSKQAPHFMMIAFPKEQQLKGFAYTPQQEHSEGMMAKGDILVSTDGEHWTKAESFEFGNLINDPTQRFHFFKQPVNARFVKINVTETTSNSPSVAVSEVDFF